MFFSGNYWEEFLDVLVCCSVFASVFMCVCCDVSELPGT